MKSLPEPAHLEIRIDEWRVAQREIDAVDVEIRWRGAKQDSAFADLLAALPPRQEFVAIRLVDGRTELAFKSWQGVRFGKGPPIFESARSHYEAWAGGPADPLPTARKYLTEMIRRYVPNFDDYSDKLQVDFIIRTQGKINAIHDRVQDFIAHLEYASPERKPLPPLKNPLDNVRAAVFSDVLGSTRQAGEVLGVPLPLSDEGKSQNETVDRRAERGRELLLGYFGEAEWKTKVERMREYRRWWKQYESLDDPKDQFYALLAKACGTSPEYERLRAKGDGFDKKIDEWAALLQERQRIEERQEENKYNDNFAWPGAEESERRSIQDKQFRIQDSDERFSKAFSVFDAPPGDRP